MEFETPSSQQPPKTDPVMEEIAKNGLSFFLYLKLMKKWWLYPVVWVLIFSVSAWLISITQKPIYEATAKIMILETSSATNGMTPYLSDQTAQSITNSLVPLIETENFQKQVIDQVALNQDDTRLYELKNKLQGFNWYSLVLSRKNIIICEHVRSTTVLSLYGLGFTPEEAVNVANSAGEILKQNIQELYQDKTTTVNDIEPAYNLGKPFYPDIRKNVSIAFLFAFITGLIGIYIFGDLKTRRKLNLK